MSTDPYQRYLTRSERIAEALAQTDKVAADRYLAGAHLRATIDASAAPHLAQAAAIAKRMRETSSSDPNDALLEQAFRDGLRVDHAAHVEAD